MINTNRVVPSQAIDLISLYGIILKQNNATLAAVDTSTTNGQFDITAAETPLIASEPVQSIDFASGVTSATVYFVPAYDYVGFTINGEAATLGEYSEEVIPDGRTLYKASLNSGDITITKVGI